MPTNVHYEALPDSIHLMWDFPRDHNEVVVRGYTVGWGEEQHVDSMAISLAGKETNNVQLDGLRKADPLATAT
ncbi:unnamed protein product [Soboliphyme baturini]|uniref:Fibronectin type-III domain-containing protein n=1 Tax=Soboliphyme baturini TaxID=241478 RepID=A0A183IJE0_9BILA|nr:unnamed protein product [Soboliphyme baturini]